MALRSFAGISTQLGVETTSGTTAPANRSLLGFTIDPKPSFETYQVRASGIKVPTATILVSEKTEADWESTIDYQSIVYVLSSLFGSVTPANASGNYTWTWTYTGKGSITPVTYTVERGDSTRASRFNNAAFTSADFTLQKQGENTMSGNMIGREMAHGVSLTASPTSRDPLPVLGTHLDVYADATSAALGTTKLADLFEAKLSMGDILSEVYTIDSTKASFTTLVNNGEPQFEWTMTVGADAVGEAYFSSIRNGTPTFLRLVAQKSATQKIEIDMCVGVTSIDSYQNTQESYTLGLTFGLLYSSAWGKAMEIRVTNQLATL